MGDNKEREYNKRILPDSSGETTNGNKLHTNLTTIVTGHMNIKLYLHRFRNIEAPDCPCGNGNQTLEHILIECGILQEERERLIAAVAKTDNWSIKKDTLMKRHYKAFARFTKTIDKINEINKVKKNNNCLKHISIHT